MKSEEKDVDYAEFYLKAQKEFKQIADCVNKRDYFHCPLLYLSQRDLLNQGTWVRKNPLGSFAFSGSNH